LFIQFDFHQPASLMHLVNVSEDAYKLLVHRAQMFKYQILFLSMPRLSDFVAIPILSDS